jgi:hypothetical protein
MDPDIAAKVQFTNSVSDMEKFISRDQIVKELGGSEQWEYKYIEPEENENATMQDTTTRDALIRERQQIGEEFMAFTSEWIEAANSQDKAKTQSAASQRTYLAERLRVNYWKLDPYVRARLCLDRMRVIQKDGKVNFYPKEDDIEETKESPKVSEFHHVESINGTATQTPVS